MTIVNKSGNIQKNADVPSRLCLENTPQNPAWVPLEEHHLEMICVTNIGTGFLQKVKESYKMDRSCNILCQFLIKDCKDPLFSSKLDEVWKKAYDERRFHLLDRILYDRTKNTCFMDWTDRTLIKTILNKFHDSVVSGHLSEHRKSERVKACSWWLNKRKDFSKYFQTFDRIQKANISTGNKFGMMIQIQEPKSQGK
ncbi:hypothetical protein O181_045731 [Austropuccinia psidii MF-1]|uniref:Integrase zinc-binding domain-containing protein n=1 Tax=Austropuccinia psidii MF-1 TaxID=1389203 RepID=A0A9Q3DSV0_9BASI|nr:hypothetical protein [Austropuccinia psidii MF-1]